MVQVPAHTAKAATIVSAGGARSTEFATLEEAVRTFVGMDPALQKDATIKTGDGTVYAEDAIHALSRPA